MARQVFNIAALLSLMLAVALARVWWQYGDAWHTLLVVQHKDSADYLYLTPDGLQFSRTMLHEPGSYSSYLAVVESYSGAIILFLVLPSIWLIREFKLYTDFTETEDGASRALAPGRRWAIASLAVGVLGPAFLIAAYDVVSWLDFVNGGSDSGLGFLVMGLTFLVLAIPVVAVVFAYQAQPKWQGDKIGEVGKTLTLGWFGLLIYLMVYDTLSMKFGRWFQ